MPVCQFRRVRARCLTAAPNRIAGLLTLLITVSMSPAGDIRAESPEDSVKALLKRHCSRCHGPDRQEGQLRVDSLTGDFTNRENATAWIEVRNRINLGEMPPEGEAALPPTSIRLISAWVTTNLRTTERSRMTGGGNVLLRRMNRHEYTNTISDLLSMRFPTGESPLDELPPDGSAEGFDTVSAALQLDPSLLETYYRVARRIADRAIVDGPPEYPTARMRLEFEEIADSNAIGYLVTRLGMKPVEGGLELVEGSTRSFGMLRYPGRRDNNVAPVNGFYRFTIRAAGARGADGEIPRIRLRHNHPDDKLQTVFEVDVKAPWNQPETYSVVIPRDTLGGELQVQLTNETRLTIGQRPGENFMRRNTELGDKGQFAETIRLSGRKIAEGWGGDRSTPDPEKLDLSRFPRVFLDYLEVEGPLYDQWPPRSHTTILFRGEEADDPRAYAREIFARFLPRAWRRPVDEDDLQPILRVVETELDHGVAFHEAIRIGVTAALTSPRFLYLLEPLDSATPGTVDDYELASRLSYLLWSSMPDDELFELAGTGALHDAETLKQQVDRMLSDSKSRRFVEGFARQWLRTDTFLAFMPDQNLYRDYDNSLADAIVREPLEFFHTILNEDLAVLNFIDSDFVVVNQRLAEHYGIPGVEGEQFQRIRLPEDSPRGGLLGMAGVHQAGSDGVRTKPVSRAVYVREVLFNDPPDPPPPNAGEIEPNIRGERLTVRERLLQHQQIDACAACHRSLDPYGLALENFNVIGMWREHQDGESFRGSNSPTIDASGRLPNGAEFQSFREFRDQLMKQDNRFRRSLVEKLFVYALGRPIEPADDLELQTIVETMARDGDTLRALIKALVTSKGFLQQ